MIEQLPVMCLFSCLVVSLYILVVSSVRFVSGSFTCSVLSKILGVFLPVIYCDRFEVVVFLAAVYFSNI